MNAQHVVEGFIRALAAQDESRAASFLSQDFGMQGGADRAGHLAWELEQFSERRRLLERGFTVRPIRVSAAAHVYGIFDHRGWFLVEDEFFLGADGLLVGNQRHFDVVTKLYFVRGQPVRRAVAVPRPQAIHARMLARGVSDEQVGCSPTEECLTLKFRLEGDDLAHRLLPIRVISKSVAATHEVEFRGIGNAYFVPELFARIDGRRVLVPADRMNIWCVTVMLADGRSEVISHPDRLEYEFDEKVLQTTVTDALDHDWEERVCNV